MNKKASFSAVLLLFVAGACAAPQKTFATPQLLSKTTQYATIALTETPKPTNPNTASRTATPATVPDIPQNLLIAFSGRTGINIISPNGGTPLVISEYLDGLKYYFSPSWSPSGDRITFAMEGPAIGSQIYIINRDGSGLRLVRDNVYFGDPSWSPDGDEIAFTTDIGLFATSPDGPSLQHLVKMPYIHFPAWSPSGKQLAILGDSSSFYGPYKIFLVDRDGKNIHSITEAIAGASRLTWSPDGTKIAFRSFDGCGDIEVLDLKKGDITNLTNSPDVVHLDPAWSPDGNFIAYSQATFSPCTQGQVYYYEGNEIYIMQSDGKNEKRLTNANGDQPSWWPTLVLQPNWQYRITKKGSNLNVRQAPSTSATSLTKLPQDTIITILDGPVTADGYRWWHIRTDSNVEGWCVDTPGWFVFESAKDTNP